MREAADVLTDANDFDARARGRDRRRRGGDGGEENEGTGMGRTAAAVGRCHERGRQARWESRDKVSGGEGRGSSDIC